MFDRINQERINKFGEEIREQMDKARDDAKKFEKSSDKPNEEFGLKLDEFFEGLHKRIHGFTPKELSQAIKRVNDRVVELNQELQDDLKSNLSDKFSIIDRQILDYARNQYLFWKEEGDQDLTFLWRQVIVDFLER